jgi:hypothetical protein
MENYGRWSLLGAATFVVVGVYMLIKGVGPEWHSYVVVAAVWISAAAWTGRYIYDLGRTRRAHAEKVAEEAQTHR